MKMPIETKFLKLKTKTRNKNQTHFSTIGLTIFELRVMETEL